MRSVPIPNSSASRDNQVSESEITRLKQSRSKPEIASKEKKNKNALREWLQINGSPFYKLLK